MPEEVEIKFGVPPLWVWRVEETRQLRDAASSAKVQSLRSVYYDTPDQRLYKSGISLRVRFDGERHVQTIKSDAYGYPGLAGRGEWETVVDDDRPHLKWAKDTPLAPLVSRKLKRNLKPIFETRVERKVFPLRIPGAAIEVAIDRGEIITASTSADISELELELKGGARGKLFGLAGIVADVAPVHLEVRSKAERGYALVNGSAANAEGARDVFFSDRATVADAFRVIARSCLRQIGANEPAVNRDDPDGVHQMRVGLRRLRAAISLFGVVLADRETGLIKQELKWLTSALAPVRQLHVFDEQVVKALRQADFGEEAVDALTADVARRREAAGVRAKGALASERYRRLLLDLARWIDAGKWLNGANQELLDEEIPAFASNALAERTAKVIKRGRRIRRMNAEQRHKLRIESKKLRYAAESFASLYSQKANASRLKAFVARLQELQDSLGALNDTYAHEQLSAEIAASGVAKQRLRLQYVAGAAAGHEEAQRDALLRASCRAHRRFARTREFWS